MPTEDQSPLVTIGMPIYNEGRFLERALDSLLAQDYENIQILIADNASTDDTGDVASRAASADSRIKYSRTDENIGSAANFRRVADMAEGKYFMWAAGHDEWSENLISDSVATLEASESASLAFASSYWVNEAGEREAARIELEVNLDEMERDDISNNGSGAELESVEGCARSKARHRPWRSWQAGMVLTLLRAVALGAACLLGL